MARVLQWPQSAPLLVKKSSSEREIDTAHKLAEAGKLLLVFILRKTGYVKIWLEKIADDDNGYLHPYRYPGTVPEGEEPTSWIINVYPTHPMYELLLADKPVIYIEFWFEEIPSDPWHTADASAYLTPKKVEYTRV
jgi:hypothetical protein